jgi:type IV pilus assembly protein PilV
MPMKQTRHCKQNGIHPHTAGFTLVEVLVALIIIAIGMLGLAKIEALAYASTGIAGTQSLAALQASSLVSAMRANRNYWSTLATTTEFKFIVKAGSITTSTDATLTNTYACASGAGTNAPCTPAQLAAYDLNDTTNGWIKALDAVLPNPTATIDCPVPLAGAQLGCSIQITWVENTVAVNSQSQASALPPPTYTVFVVP